MSFAYQNDYELLENAYYGEGGFKDGSYLIQHPREKEDKYQKRQELSYYLNYVATVVNAHVDPIFKSEPDRQWQSDIFSQFVENVDTAGTKLTRFMKLAGMQSKLHGISFIVMDNISADSQPMTMADVLARRKFPYCYIVDFEQVTGWRVNMAGRLMSITYTVNSESADSLSDGTKQDVWTWTTRSWSVLRPDGSTKTATHSLGCVPVVPLFSRPMKPGKIDVQSEFYSIARTNLRIFNLCSEIDEIIRNQAFNILTYPAGDQEQQAVKEIIVGTENVLAYDGMLSNRPDYISPDAGPLQELRAERKDLIQEIYRMAVLSFATGVQEAKSGVAKEWDFQSTNQAHADFATNCQAAEYALATLFELWTKTSIDFSCKYSDDFGIVDIVEKLNEITTAKDLGIGGEFDKELNKKAAVVLFNDLPEDRYDAVMNDIENRALDKQMSDDDNGGGDNGGQQE